MDRIDTIERTITVASPIGRVWEALTVADELAGWFGDSAWDPAPNESSVF